MEFHLSPTMLDQLQSSVTTPYLLGGLFVLFVGYKIYNRVAKNARIRKLGARAPIRPSYLPYGIDLAYEVVRHALKDKSYDLWVSMFARWSPGSYTLEGGIGERVILTAEPDNIKAILATQFKDYGKGEQFHKDWHPFLGNGMSSPHLLYVLNTPPWPPYNGPYAGFNGL